MRSRQSSRLMVGGAGTAVASARLVSLAAAAVQLPILTRVLPASEYGALAVAMAVATYFSLVTAEPSTLAFQRHPGSFDERGNYAFALSRIVPSIVVGGAIIVIVALFWGNTALALAVVAWGCGLACARYTATAWLMWDRPWNYSFNLMASTSARTATLVVLVVIGSPGLVALIVAGIVSAAVSLVLAPRASMAGQVRARRPWPRELGYLLAAASLGVTIMTNINVIIVERQVGPAEAAPFAAMAQLAALSGGALTSMLLTVLYPSLRRRWDDGQRTQVIRSAQQAELTMIAIGAVCVTLLTVGDGLAARIAVDESLVDLSILTPLVIALTLGAVGQVSGWLHQFQTRARQLARRTALAAGLTALLLAALVFATPLEPTTGGAIATALGFALYVLLLRGRRSFSEPLVTIVIGVFVALALGGSVAPPVVVTSVAATLAAFTTGIVLTRSRRTR